MIRKSCPALLLFPINLIAVYPKHSPSEGLGAARAAIERASRTISTSPKTPMILKAHMWRMKNLRSTINSKLIWAVKATFLLRL